MTPCAEVSPGTERWGRARGEFRDGFRRVERTSGAGSSQNAKDTVVPRNGDCWRKQFPVVCRRCRCTPFSGAACVKRPDLLSGLSLFPGCCADSLHPQVRRIGPNHTFSRDTAKFLRVKPAAWPPRALPTGPAPRRSACKLPPPSRHGRGCRAGDSSPGGRRSGRRESPAAR